MECEASRTGEAVRITGGIQLSAQFIGARGLSHCIARPSSRGDAWIVETLTEGSWSH